MHVEILARIQFALTIMFHYIYPPLSIGLGLALVIMEAAYLRTKNDHFLKMAKFWTKIFALTFAVGVATGIVMEFEFGTNWSTYSRYVGDVFGSALAAEGVFAFFLESGFLAILLFGWNRVGPKMHFFSTLMVCLGAHFSAIWIIVANSWMQTPAGFHIVGEGLRARAEIIDFWAMVFNPSSVMRLLHSVIGAWLAGAFLLISVAAYYLIKQKYSQFAKDSLKMGLSISLVALFLQVIVGDASARIVSEYQPSKLAAIEANYKTTKEAPYTVFGVVNSKEERVDYALQVPYLLSFLTHRDISKEVMGLDQFPKRDWPNVAVVFQTYRLMIVMWVIMLIVTVMAIIMWRRNTLFTHKGMLWVLVFSVVCPQIANQAGWVTAEMGRYPWIVFNLLRISEGLSKSVTANQVLGSIIMFSIVYFFLLVMFIYLLHQKIQHGPEEKEEATPYHLLKNYVEEIKHDSH
jgi:cytochrome d ubiquinol oxidase subunit I